jgi:hypothetical protein
MVLSLAAKQRVPVCYFPQSRPVPDFSVLLGAL